MNKKSGKKISPKSAVQNVPVERIRAGSNDRTVFNEEKLKELADSIAKNGLAQPITVRVMDGGEWFQIVAGERRFRAMAQVLGWAEVPAIVRELTDEEASAIMLVENTSRVDLDPIAEASAYASRIELYGWTRERVAETAGVSVERVRQRLSLLKLADEVQHLVKVGQMPLGHAVLLEELDINRQRIAVTVYREAKVMPLSRWREVLATLLEQQMAESQMSMFDLQLMMVQAVQADAVTPLRGKRAVTGAPTADHLPKPRAKRTAEPAGDFVERYILDLINGGHVAEASAIGTLYNALVAGNWVSVPAGSALAKAFGGSEVGDDTYTTME